MEPHLRDEQVKLIDTGQGSSSPSSSTLSASAPVPLELSAGEGFVNNEDAPRVAVCSENNNPEDGAYHIDDLSSLSQSAVSLFADTLEGAGGSDSPESVCCFDVSQEDYLKSVETRPKIFIGMEDEDPREVGSSNDDDMDPLITVDDTESQVSDLINFDTVSYDVIRQLGDDEEEDDDEKSIATLSSLSCDIRMDSPVDRSQHSNSSSLVNLLDSSMKDTTGIGVCSSAEVPAEGMRSTESSCPSSPALHSAKTVSSVMDESISEACTNLLPDSEASIDFSGYDPMQWNEATSKSKDISSGGCMNEAGAIDVESSLSISQDSKPFSQLKQDSQPETENNKCDTIDLDEKSSRILNPSSKSDQLSDVSANAMHTDDSKDQKDVPTTPLNPSFQKIEGNDCIGGADEICATANSVPAAKNKNEREPLISSEEIFPDSTSTPTIDEDWISESELIPEHSQKENLITHDLSHHLKESSTKSSDQALFPEDSVSTSTMLGMESHQVVLSDVSVSSKYFEEDALNTSRDTTVNGESPSGPGTSFTKSTLEVCSNDVISSEFIDESALGSPLQPFCDKRRVSMSSNETDVDIMPEVPSLLNSVKVDTLDSSVQLSLDEGVSSSGMPHSDTEVGSCLCIPPDSKSAEGSTSSCPVQQVYVEEMTSLPDDLLNETNSEILQESLEERACDLLVQSLVCDQSVSSTSEALNETISEINSIEPDLTVPSPNSPAPSNQILLPELLTSEEVTAPLKTLDVTITNIVSSTLGGDQLQKKTVVFSPSLQHKDQEKICEVTEAVMTSPPNDSTESARFKSCESSEETAEVGLTDIMPVISPELDQELCQELEQISSEEKKNPQDYVCSKNVSEGKTEDCISFQNLLGDSLRSDKMLGCELSPKVSDIVEDVNEVVESKDFSLEVLPLRPEYLGITGENLCVVEDRPIKPNLVDAAIIPSVPSCNCDENCDCETKSLTEDCNKAHIYEMEDTELQEPESALECKQIASSVMDNFVKHPTLLLDLKPSALSSPDNVGGMNFSDFLSLMSPASPQKTAIGKQYSVTALDEAQQTACYLVDDVIQKAAFRVDEIISSRVSVCDNAAKTAQLIVDDVLVKAVTQSSDEKNWDQNTDRRDSNFLSSGTKTMIQDHINHVPEESLNGLLELGMDSMNNCNDKQNESIPDIKTKESLASTPSETGVVQDQSATESVTKAAITLSSSSSEVDLDRFSSDVINLPVLKSSSNSAAEAYLKDESARTSSPETAASDSARSSLLTGSDVGLRSEASLFVDGVLKEAAKKYEESSSSESSPIKLKSLALDSEYQDEEELATPCGEMLTEHFMDFESGRNVSVFCSIPENGSDDHLMAYDRVANTIGNREVDSDTGKSLSIFRIEEDVFYEIQRASTCTSVFESVEEEDEDMIDTTIPLEDRYDKMSQTSESSSDSNTDKQNLSDEPLRTLRTDNDAFEDAVGAFLTKERLTRDENNQITSEEMQDSVNREQECNQLVKRNTCRALVLRHPEYDLSNQEEKKRMAEKWANGGESTVPDTPEMHKKLRAIREALDSDEDAADVAIKLCQLALTEGGLINDELRKEAWPRMLGLDPTLEIDAPSLEDLKEHPEYGQVVLDVNRSLKRFPPDIPKDRRETLQDKLTRLIMYVISKHPHLRYYQGYHDVAVTFLLVVGESVAFQIMERLSTENLSDCMQPTMERTSYLLHFIYPLLHRLHPTLADYLERSEVGTMFCLPWFLTWFGHSLDRYQDVVRLYDHFLASPPLAPLYVAAVLVAHRADEVLAVDCDMAAIHALLSHIPDTLPLEILLRDATDLYMKFPPESIEREVEERFKNEQEMRVHEMEAREKLQLQRALRRRRGHSTGSGSWQLAEFQDRVGGTMMVLNRWMPPWVVQQQRLSMRLLFASATFFVGFYVYSRGGDMLPYL